MNEKEHSLKDAIIEIRDEAVRAAIADLKHAVLLRAANARLLLTHNPPNIKMVIELVKEIEQICKS